MGFIDMLKLKINGIDRINEVLKGSIVGSETINARSTCSFSLLDLYGNGKPELGTSVELFDEEDNKVFGGMVDKGTKTRLSSSNVLQYDITCCDYHQLAEKRLIAETYVNKTAGYIVNHIITNYLTDENITAGIIATGATFTKVTFSYKKASDCLDELSSLTGSQWVINPDKTLDFFEKRTNTASWNVTDSSQINNIVIEDNREEYRNVQYVRGVKGITSTKINSFNGDGKTQVFTCSYPLSTKPSLKINAVSVPTTDIGIKEVDDDKLWYWAKSEKEIIQTSTETALSSTQTLEVTFKGEFPTIIMRRKEDQILKRQNVENNSGLYEKVEINKTIETENSGLEYARGKLRRYAQFNKVLGYTTELNGLKAGQIQNVNKTFFGISGEFLIEQINFTALGDGKIEYSIKAISGESVGGWTYFFKELLKRGEEFVIGENEILVKAKELSDNMTFSETITVSKSAVENRIGYAQIGFCEID